MMSDQMMLFADILKRGPFKVVTLCPPWKGDLWGLVDSGGDVLCLTGPRDEEGCYNLCALAAIAYQESSKGEPISNPRTAIMRLEKEIGETWCVADNEGAVLMSFGSVSVSEAESQAREISKMLNLEIGVDNA